MYNDNNDKHTTYHSYIIRFALMQAIQTWSTIHHWDSLPLHFPAGEGFNARMQRLWRQGLPPKVREALVTVDGWGFRGLIVMSDDTTLLQDFPRWNIIHIHLPISFDRIFRLWLFIPCLHGFCGWLRKVLWPMAIGNVRKLGMLEDEDARHGTEGSQSFSNRWSNPKRRMKFAQVSRQRRIDSSYCFRNPKSPEVLRITPELFEIHKQRALEARKAQEWRCLLNVLVPHCTASCAKSIEWKYMLHIRIFTSYILPLKNHQCLLTKGECCIQRADHVDWCAWKLRISVAILVLNWCSFGVQWLGVKA